jgi:hypothetical protein
MQSFVLSHRSNCLAERRAQHNERVATGVNSVPSCYYFRRVLSKLKTHLSRRLFT